MIDRITENAMSVITHVCEGSKLWIYAYLLEINF